MYILNKPFALMGIAISALSTVFCPFLKVPLVGNWNLYQTDLSLFYVTMGFLGFAVFAFVLRKISLFKIVSYSFLGWCTLGFVAVYFKITNFFGVKLFDGLLAKTIHIKWGWFFLFLGAIIMILSVRKMKEVK